MPLPRFSDPSRVEGPAILTPQGSAAPQLAQVAQTLNGISQRVGRERSRREAERGRREGLAAGMDPEFQNAEGNSEYARAFNAAGETAMLQRLDTEMRMRAEEIYQKNSQDSVALGRAFEAERQQILSSGLLAERPDLAAQLGAGFDRVVLGYNREAGRATLARERDAARAAGETWAQQSLNDVTRLAASAGLDVMADQAVAGEYDALEQGLLRYGPQGEFEFGGEAYEADASRAGTMSLTEIARTLEGARRQISEARFMGAFSRLDDVSAQEAFFEDFNAGLESGESAFADLQPGDITRMQARMGTAINQSRAAIDRSRRENLRAIEEAMGQVSDVTDAGLAVDPGVFESLAQQFAANGDLDGAAQALEAGETARAVDWAYRQDPAQLDADLRAERTRLASGATPEEARRLTALEGARARMVAAIERDPLAFAARAGVVDVPPLEFVDSDGAPSMAALSGSLTARADRAQQVAQTYGQNPVYFTEAERNQFAQLLERDPAARLSMAEAIVTGLGADAARAALAELAPRDDQLAHLGALMADGNVYAAQQAHEGAQLRAEAGFQSVLPSADNMTIRNERLMGHLQRTLPRTSAQFNALAQNIYTREAARRGMTRDDWDMQLWDRSVQMATGASWQVVGRREVRFGGLSEYRGRQVLAPAWLRADRLDDVVRDASETARAAMGGAMYDARGNEVDVNQLRRAHLITIAPGQYHVAWGARSDGTGGSLALSEDGRPYVLDLQSARAALAQDHPEWVMQ